MAMAMAMAMRKRAPADVMAYASVGYRSGRQRAGLLVLGIGLAWLSLMISIDNTIGRRAPEIAAQWGAGSATVAAMRAEQLAQPGATQQQIAEAHLLGQQALSREPINLPAVRTLAQAAALRNDLAGAERLFTYAESLSRRDLVTQLWQIEAKVRANDVQGALRHYDRALRTSFRARPLLFPVLASAASDPNVARPLGRLLAARPGWALDFLAVVANDQQASPTALATLLNEARLRASVPAERAPLATALARLTASGRYREAYALYQQAIGASSIDYGFNRDPLLPPFDWSLADEADLTATIEPRGQGKALALQASDGSAGEFARRLLILAPGTYRIGFNASGAGTDPLARAAVSLQCVKGDSLTHLPVTTAARSQSVFTVPTSNCPAQWLVIAAPNGMGSAGQPVILEDLAIRRYDEALSEAAQQRRTQ
jgi:tetratricopeptide (TPR) repeat protein